MSDGQENINFSSVENVENIENNVFDESSAHTNKHKPINKKSSQTLQSPRNKFIRRKKKRIEWSQEELDALEEGMKKFGTNWTLILSMSSGPLQNRTNVKLKDKARNERRRRER